ncbi:hypothetical protein FNV43_RR12351 [Rhamnella rubrinervis]|uniref:Transketolase C-terminal domain-containing protein n=1 Tax=Rhamnella rubrinervis TaxID=2594499 RepID=A0A8K0MIF6_9ROSA|nr:hypothetical protein FNV43_RR12351 [Rhamnella rubrinervis]
MMLLCFDMAQWFRTALKLRPFLQSLVEVTVADARFCKPLDIKLLRELCRNNAFLITVEEGAIGGFGSHVAQFMALCRQLDGRIKDGLKRQPSESFCTLLYPLLCRFVYVHCGPLICGGASQSLLLLLNLTLAYKLLFFSDVEGREISSEDGDLG